MIVLIERAEGRIGARGCVAEMAGGRLVERLLADVADDVVARRLRRE